MALTVLLLIAVGCIAAAVWIAVRRRARNSAPPAVPTLTIAAVPDEATEASYVNEAIDNAAGEWFKLAFGVSRFDYRILGEHAQALENIANAVDGSVHQLDYFPRRPRLLPRLLQALKDDESTRKDLVRLVLEDPSLAGQVVQRANAAYYRISPEPVETLERAVALLGAEGLRSLLTLAVQQPVFRLPKGHFDEFAPLAWEHAQRVVAAAETYGQSTRSCDPFVAQLLALLGPLARIVLFRLTRDKYRELPNVLPRAEVFIKAMQAHGPRVAHLLGTTWELSDPSIAALDEQVRQVSPLRMSALGRAIYFAELCGTLAVVVGRGKHSLDGAHAILVAQGLGRQTMLAMWRSASSGAVTAD
jgi:HD-like signal output (HDOD) protein